MNIRSDITLATLQPKLRQLFDLSGAKIRSLDKTWNPAQGTPVFTVKGKYTSRGWTEWTQGFQFGSALLQFDATGESWFLDYGRERTIRLMAPHVSHIGVHDHGFNNVSTYGNLLRLAGEGRFDAPEQEKEFYRLALKCSGAVQASRWSRIKDGRGFIYSFNGPQSLFADTIRSLRSLAVGHLLGHVLQAENDIRISLLDRLLQHASVTADYTVYYGEGRDYYDVRGRVAHESVFNPNDGNYRCPNSQQGYSPFTTWTRGLAWVILGYPEELEFLAILDSSELEPFGGRAALETTMLRAAEATADYYIDLAAADGIPYWDTGAPQLDQINEYGTRPADPYNDFEPVDSSAAAIAAQGLWRLGAYLARVPEREEASERYKQAALTIADALFAEPYLSTDENHQGLILHSVYHRPNGWDYVPPGRKIPCGESSMWGDYHARELALLLLRESEAKPPLRFFAI